jgi:Na+-translocating ferredoxin:NAD+ oxidoreductase RnfD subunit
MTSTVSAPMPIGRATNRDPRIAVAAILLLYLILGVTVLGFNRSPYQILVSTVLCCFSEVCLSRLLKKRWIWPLSALITSFGLSILLNFAHSYALLAIPIIFAIGSKYVFTFQGRHVFNPGLMGVVLSLLFTGELITAAPAYQWHGMASIWILILMPPLLFFIPGIKRTPLIVSFLFFFTILCALRAFIMRHHLPFETLFLGTITSPSFFLFTFFMITDPATSPSKTGDQVLTGFLLAALDLAYHLVQSYHTFFFAAITLGIIRFAFLHLKAAYAGKGLGNYLYCNLWASGGVLRPIFLFGFAGIYFTAANGSLALFLSQDVDTDVRFDAVSVAHTRIHAEFGNIYQRVDPRIQHIIKWIFSVGDAVATGDFDNDGKVDLFFTFTLKQDDQRNSLYRNLGNLEFARIDLPALTERNENPEKFGLSTNAIFVDYDNDGDLDLFISYAFGHSVLLQNQLRDTGVATFLDVSKAAGIAGYTNSVAATFLDVNRDGNLDLLVANVLPTDLPDYADSQPLNLFLLPQPQFSNDRRMFHFMHSSWNQANNGGLNTLLLSDGEGNFIQQNSVAWGLEATRWSLAVGTADLNHDGWTDLYVANDFGPDDLYYNVEGAYFKNYKAGLFGGIGKDTYKGMNVSMADFDRNGFMDIYVSNVHHALQAEGSLLWMFQGSDDKKYPEISDQATFMGALNEHRFGWGAAVGDFNLDGWMDIAQANGMVDDSIDKAVTDCPDYWYVNEKLARSPPSIHSYADMWGDIRGSCIYGKESSRIYLNRGNGKIPQFVDVAKSAGFDEKGNSRGVAAVDLDNDGALDLIVTHMFSSPSIYRNQILEKSQRNWVGISLHGNGRTCNREAIGSQIELEITDKNGARTRQGHEISAVNGFGAQSDRRWVLGVGENVANVTLSVNWCLHGLSPNNSIVLNKYNEIYQPDRSQNGLKITRKNKESKPREPESELAKYAPR